MKIVTLMEDTLGDNQCFYEHGLSLYIETQHHKILFDTGSSEKTLLNADRMGVDLRDVDIVVLSHGHYDHAGGLLPFSKINQSAKIYMQKTVNEDFYHGEKYIGIDKSVITLPQTCLLKGDYRIDDELFIYANITGRRFFSKSNDELSKRIHSINIPDDFCHDQCLVIFDDSYQILLSGCAHNGIVNILDKYYDLFQRYPDIVISGFHLDKKTDYTIDEIKNIQELANELKMTNALFYTGHCTGSKAFILMKNIMMSQLHDIHSGDIII